MKSERGERWRNLCGVKKWRKERKEKRKRNESRWKVKEISV